MPDSSTFRIFLCLLVGSVAGTVVYQANDLPGKAAAVELEQFVGDAQRAGVPVESRAVTEATEDGVISNRELPQLVGYLAARVRAAGLPTAAERLLLADIERIEAVPVRVRLTYMLAGMGIGAAWGVILILLFGADFARLGYRRGPANA